MKTKPYKPTHTREEVVKIVDDFLQDKPTRATAEGILSRKFTIDLLGGHDIRKDAEHYRKRITSPSFAKNKENFF